jgi:hypothetical protein
MPDAYTFALAALIGLGLGGLLSLVFGRYALPTRIPAEFTLFGYPSGVILTNLVIVAIVGAIVFLGYVSTVVQDTVFPAAHPWLFIAETLIVGFVPASVLYVMTDFRDDGHMNFAGLNKEFLFLAAKFAIFHLLFQFSGVYTYVFSKDD